MPARTSLPRLVRHIERAASEASSDALVINDGEATISFLFGIPMQATCRIGANGTGAHVVEGPEALPLLVTLCQTSAVRMRWSPDHIEIENHLHRSVDEILEPLRRMLGERTRSALRHQPEGGEAAGSDGHAFGLDDFPPLPAGPEIFANTPATLVQLGAQLGQMPATLVSYSGHGVRAAALVDGGVVVDAVWAERGRLLLGRDAAEALTGASAGTMSGHRVDSALADHLPLLWRWPAAHRALPLAWLDPDRFLESLAQRERALIVSSPQARCVALFGGGDLVGAWTDAAPEPTTDPTALYELLASRSGTVTVVEPLGGEGAENDGETGAGGETGATWGTPPEPDPPELDPTAGPGPGDASEAPGPWAPAAAGEAPAAGDDEPAEPPGSEPIGADMAPALGDQLAPPDPGSWAEPAAPEPSSPGPPAPAPAVSEHWEPRPPAAPPGEAEPAEPRPAAPAEDEAVAAIPLEPAEREAPFRVVRLPVPPPPQPSPFEPRPQPTIRGAADPFQPADLDSAPGAELPTEVVDQLLSEIVPPTVPSFARVSPPARTPRREPDYVVGRPPAERAATGAPDGPVEPTDPAGPVPVAPPGARFEAGEEPAAARLATTPAPEEPPPWGATTAGVASQVEPPEHAPQPAAPAWPGSPGAAAEPLPAGGEAAAAGPAELGAAPPTFVTGTFPAEVAASGPAALHPVDTGFAAPPDSAPPDPGRGAGAAPPAPAGPPPAASGSRSRIGIDWEAGIGMIVALLEQRLEPPIARDAVQLLSHAQRSVRGVVQALDALARALPPGMTPERWSATMLEARVIAAEHFTGG